MGSISIQQHFEENPQRAAEFRVAAAGLTLDYSRHWITQDQLKAGLSTLEHLGFQAARSAFFEGAIVNPTENRPALHMALRAPTDSYMADHLPEIVRQVHAEQLRMFNLARDIRAGQYPNNRHITDVINVGIGGSDLGPRLLVDSVSDMDTPKLNYHAVSNVDPTSWSRLENSLNPETTIVVLASKSFRTQETLENGKLIFAWLCAALGDSAWSHVFAVTANPDNAASFGVKQDHILKLWDWVGGRFSVWSSVGFAALCTIGPEKFQRFLLGAHLMDEHFRISDPENNIPAIMACLTDFYRNQHQLQTHAVVPYAESLQNLPAYLQQLEMESLGKRVRLDGSNIQAGTSQILWGQAGTNGQHAFHQLLHQGSVVSPVDLILVKHGLSHYRSQHNMLLANGLAQAHALAFGRDHEDPHRRIPGNKPCSIIGIEALIPEAIGALIAAYEHKVFTLGLIWKINPFDQFGVELGKELCDQFLTCLTDTGSKPPEPIAEWINWCRS